MANAGSGTPTRSISEILDTSRNYGKKLCEKFPCLVERNPTAACPFCGKRLFRNSSVLLIPCAECASSKRVLSGVFSIRRYDAKARKVIHSLKYGGNFRAGKCLGAQLAIFLTEKAPGLVTGKSVIIPVPLSFGRELSRGFNQTVLMGRVLSRLTGIPISPGVLKRNAFFKPSARLSSELRRLFVREAFTVNPLLLPPADHIILLDDVATTLSTLDECGRKLKKRTNPETSIWGLTVARSD